MRRATCPGPISVIAMEEIDHDDPATGIWYHVEPGYPKKIILTSEELGELASLIALMQRDLGITLTANRHFWTEDALSIWVHGQELRRDGGRVG